jgi:2-polyprenyl-3-methyl-5-hydroxy-6-metoxy-1,4-benzoquinol methylase
MPDALPMWRGLQMFLWQCIQCRHVTVQPLPTDEMLAEYYKSEYRGLQRGQLDELIIKDMLAAVDTCGWLSVHDYSCGDAYHLEQLNAARPGLRLTGYAHDPACVEKARQRGLWGVWGNPAAAAGADLVTLNHVIEHSRNPIETLVHARNSMKPDGRMLLRMPNAIFGLMMDKHEIGCSGFTSWKWCGVPWHLNYFTPASITAALQCAGLSVLNIRCSTYSEMASDLAAYNAEHMQGEELVVLAKMGPT